MPEAVVHQCQCPECLQADYHPNQELHHQLNVLLSRLDEASRRWVVAWEAKRMGRGGDRFLSLVTGIHVRTIRTGRRELAASLADIPFGRRRRRGGGRKPVEKKT